MDIDYGTEHKRMEEGSNYWKPKAGQYKLKALTELQKAEPYVKKREGEEDEINAQAKILIKINDQDEKMWTFGVGQTLASTYGQLCSLAKNHGDKLTGVEFQLIVKHDGTKNDYTIVL